MVLKSCFLTSEEAAVSRCIVGLTTASKENDVVRVVKLCCPTSDIELNIPECVETSLLVESIDKHGLLTILCHEVDLCDPFVGVLLSPGPDKDSAGARSRLWPDGVSHYH